MGDIVLPLPDTSRYQINSIYGIVNLSYKELPVCRNYRPAGLEQRTGHSQKNRQRRIFLSFYQYQFHIVGCSKDAPTEINYVKVRASFAHGRQRWLLLRTELPIPIRVADGGIYPDTSLVNPTTLPNVNLKPLLTTTFEIGYRSTVVQKQVKR